MQFSFRSYVNLSNFCPLQLLADISIYHYHSLVNHFQLHFLISQSYLTLSLSRQNYFTFTPYNTLQFTRAKKYCYYYLQRSFEIILRSAIRCPFEFLIYHVLYNFELRSGWQHRKILVVVNRIIIYIKRGKRDIRTRFEKYYSILGIIQFSSEPIIE